MKSCPTCQQVYPDNGPDYCPNDRTPLVSSPAGYNQGATPGSQWQPPPPNWGYTPSDQYQPSAPDASTPGSSMLSSAALFTGIGAIFALVLGFILSASAASSYPPSMGTAKFAGILFFLMIIAGITAINTGIVAIALANRNPGRKAKGIVGLCLGILPFIILIILIMAANGPRPF
jgi:hypothetical protein